MGFMLWKIIFRSKSVWEPTGTETHGQLVRKRLVYDFSRNLIHAFFVLLCWFRVPDMAVWNFEGVGGIFLTLTIHQVLFAVGCLVGAVFLYWVIGRLVEHLEYKGIGTFSVGRTKVRSGL
jgi:hypothetical protein